MRMRSKYWVYSFAAIAVLVAAPVWAAKETQGGSMTLWDLFMAGGFCMFILLGLSIAATASILYHLMNVSLEKMAPRDFTDNLLTLLEKKQLDKAIGLCAQQKNLISSIALPGLKKKSKGLHFMEEAIQFEGKARIEGVWQNLTYLGDLATVAPMVGLLGTIIGMIEAFHFFRVGMIHPVVLTQGLAKAMINTAFGLVVAVPCLSFYSIFRGRVSRITSTAESVASEIIQIVKDTER